MVAIAFMGIGCQTDYFNEQYLPGYENNGEITDVQELNITLTADDYATIAKNSENKAIAEAAGAADVLSAISKNKYFATADDAALYIPAFLKSSYVALDNGSVALVTYTTAVDVPEDVVLMNAPVEYTLTEDDYKAIWGSEEEYAMAVTPKTINKLKSVLPVAEDARNGEYMVVTYNYSAEEPAKDEPSTPDTPDTPDTPEQPAYTSVLGTAALNDSVEVKGYISAISTQGPILTDNGGSVLLYKTTDVKIGDEVTVTGTISAYNLGFQISSAVVEKTGTTTVTYPEPVEWDGAAMDALLTTRVDNDYAQFVKFTGVPSISDKGYVNIAVEGAETAQGSIYGASDEVKALFTEGEAATVYGYFCSVSSGKFINVIVVSVNDAPAIGGGEVANNYTSVLGTAVLDDVVEVKGYISAESSMGPILTDNGGSVLLYQTTGYVVGDEVTVTGTISSYNCGFQIGTNGLTIEKTGTTTVTYPAPMELTGAVMDELLNTRVEDEYAYYAKMTGELSISTNSDGTKTYYNFNVPGTETAVGSLYGVTDALKAQLTDGMECTLYGYFCSISKAGGAPKYINIIVTSVEAAATPAAKALALTVKSEKQYAYFKLDGGKYVDAAVVAVQPSDYTNMGQGYGSFTHPAQDNYLAQFLGEKYPYAQLDDKAYVGYRCYASGATSWRVDEYNFTGEWVKVAYFMDKTDQFRKAEGVWNIDRTLELDFTNTSGADTKAFYQYCVNWVYDFKDVPMGAPARDNAGEIVSTEIVLIGGNKPAGNYWVSNYGNNEFYTGASAYYGNMDWRPSAVKGGFAAAGMGDLSDDEILAKLKENTAEVFAAVLGYVYPEMTPEEYKKVVIKVYCYGPNKNYSYTFSVVEQGKFEYVADSITEL